MKVKAREAAREGCLDQMHASGTLPGVTDGEPEVKT